MISKKVDKKPNKLASSKYWLGITVVHILIPLILLVCGGDLAWWQACVYALLILVAGVGSRIWAESVHPGLMKERSKAGKEEGPPSSKARVLARLLCE